MKMAQATPSGTASSSAPTFASQQMENASLAQDRQRVSQQEDEDQEHEDDGKEAADLDAALDQPL